MTTDIAERGERESPPRLAHPMDAPAYERGSGYSARSVRNGRPLGLILTVAVHALVLGLFLFQWTARYAPKPLSTLNTFDIPAPPSPPEPQSDAPQEPQPMRREKTLTDPDTRRNEPPKIVLSIDESAAPPRPPDPAAARAIEEPAAAEAKPPPPPQEASDARPTWQGRVLAALNKVKRYPREASFRRRQGVPIIRFVMDRSGRVLSASLERSSGVPALDGEALELPRRAQPLPKPPEDVPGATIELVVPVEFYMR